MSGVFCLAIAVAISLSFALDCIAVPRAPLRRPVVSSVLHVLSVVWVSNMMLAVTGRPILSALVAVALVGLVAAVSNAKYETLRESLVFTDLSLFSQLFSHPRLYLPFLSVEKVSAIVSGAAFVLGGFYAEKQVAVYSPLSALAIAVSIILIARFVVANMPLTLDPCIDQGVYGCFAVFVAYLMDGLRPATFAAFRRAMDAGPFNGGEPKAGADVIVIQSESFFDVRRISSAIDPALLTHFARAQHEADYCGELIVPAWGANTMRTEFAVLTGVPSASLGYARFYPYAFVRRACASLARWFGRAGYDTVAIHPYHADFFGRDRVFPLLGFEVFLDIGHFTNAEHVGQYVSDAAVADAIVAAMDVPQERPRFIFAMTMENHGPMHLEQVLPGESATLHGLGDNDSWHDLTAYLRHIANADKMIGVLLDKLRRRERETVVCFYGDHVPAIPKIFEKLGVLPKCSDYFIWRNRGLAVGQNKSVYADELGLLLLHAMHQGRSRVEKSRVSEKAM